MAYTVNGIPKFGARPDLGQNDMAAFWVVKLTVDRLGSTCARGKGNHAAAGEVAMISKGVEARAGTTDIVGPWSLPSVVSGDINQLVLVESCEWETAWSSLSLCMLFLCFRRISLFEMLC